ncbi:MAG: C25 family cysteine peptidase [Planctomycetota bacterium]
MPDTVRRGVNWIIVILMVAFCLASDTLFAQGQQAEEIDTLVICPDAFRSELKRWVDYRKGQGFKVQVEKPGRSALEVRKQILEVAKRHELTHIVLIGDSGDRQTDAAVKVPTDYVMARDKFTRRHSPEIATDNRYADFDDDGIPDVSIGRIPVDSAAELKDFVDRVINYEQKGLPVESLRRISFVAGVGGFGKLIDGVIEETTKQIITDLMPGQIETTMTYGSWTSPYCPDPRKFSQCTIDRFNEGCLFWVYIGHGGAQALDWVYMPDQFHEILDCKSACNLCSNQGSPIAIFLACFTNAADGEEDCLAEIMLKQKCGPVASIGGTRVTKPAAMGLLALGMMHDYFHNDTKTIGEIFLNAKRSMVRGDESFKEYRDMIEGLAKSFSPGGSFKIEKMEHAQLLHLLGDPLLSIPRPQKITFGTTPKPQAGETITISGKSPSEGTMVLELAYRRDRLKERFPRRRRYDSSEASFTDYQQTYDQARNLVCCQVEVEVKRGMFSAEMTIPSDVDGDCVVRAMLESNDGPGLGSTAIEIQKRPSESKRASR